MDEPRLSLDSERAAKLFEWVPDHVRVELIATANHTWRVVADGEVYYVKAHTKPWYGGEPAPDAVRHEVTAHQLLGDYGLPTPEIVDHSVTRDNPLGWPYLLTSGLDGTALTDLLPLLSSDAAEQVLRHVGAHLGEMHAITFDYPGYFVDGPPAAPPDPTRWQHGIWRFERYLADAVASWADIKPELDRATMDTLAVLIADKLPALRVGYDPPRFVHGDCHADQFFLVFVDGCWQVAGVLDLEVASAGSPLWDFVKFTIQMAGHFGAGPLRWWEPFFDGYAGHCDPVDFDLLRLALTAAHYTNYTCLGSHSWPGTRADIVRHVLGAHSWSDLFDVRRR